VAANTVLPVIGVPIETKTMGGLDSLLSTVQMPSGVPVAAVAIGGARNAGLLAVQIIATGNAKLADQLAAFKAKLAAESRAKNEKLKL
jgi:5-(carboxyamino)imidazole ribonucleotide mutase